MSRSKGKAFLYILFFVIGNGGGGLLTKPIGEAHAAEWQSPLWNMQAALTKIQNEAKEKNWIAVDKLGDTWGQLSPVSWTEDDVLQTARFQHYHQGLEVVGSWVQVHKSKWEEKIQKNISQFSVDTIPKLSVDEAIGAMRAHWNEQALSNTPELKILPSADPEQKTAQLIWWMKLNPEGELPGRDILIDATSGEMIANISHRMEIDAPGMSRPAFTTLNLNQLKKVAPVDVYDAADISANEVVNLSRFDKVISKNRVSGTVDSSAVRAYSNARKVLTYFLRTHGRNSFDDNGATAVNIVHFGRNMANAFWDGDQKVMAYGDGDGRLLRDLTYGLDVAGHEMTHAVISNTSQLLYFGESGALNESYADFFGEMIENKANWVMGQSIFVDSAQSKHGIRDLKDPHALTATYYDDSFRPVTKAYPAHVTEAFKASGGCWAGNDLCFVHINSTIPSHAAYKVSEAIGKSKTEKLWYIVLTHYLTPRSGFKAMKSATMQACAMLYDSETCAKVSDAFADVGL